MTMALQLIGSLTSPYARKMRLLLQNEVGYEFKSINYLEKNDSDYLKSINPLNQIPVVIDNGVTIYDSRVIYNYFAAKKGWAPLSIESENYLSAIDTALDTGINLFSLRRGGLNITDGSNGYIERQRERIPLILNYLTPWVKGLTPEKDWNFVTMSLYSFLFWIEFREVYSLKNHPEMTDFLERFKNAPGVAETAIPV
jgi:glutathione S-transferase